MLTKFQKFIERHVEIICFSIFVLTMISGVVE